MKKFLIIVGSLFVLLLATIILIPIIFEDDIRQALDDAVEENVNAEVYYDVDGFSLSLIKNFPDLTVSIKDFGVVGVEEFASDTLASIGNFQVTVDIMSVISGDQIVVEEILLEQSNLNILVLADGKANYDIAKEKVPVETTKDATKPEEQAPTEDSDNTSAESSPEGVNIGIERWAIVDANLSYSDKSMNFFTLIEGMNHEGSGDFSLDILDLISRTTIRSFSLGYEDVTYISNKSIEADLILNLDLANGKYTFKENRIGINGFDISADGYISMPDDDINMDINFSGKEIDLKSILSLIPGVYQEYLDGVSASGEVNFDGYVKGIYNDNSMPKVAANLSVDKGKISYADFKIPMEQITIKSSFSYPSSDLAQTSFNIDKFYMLVDGEPLSAYLKFKNLENYQWDFGVDGYADLEKITKIIPVEGMTLQGKINAKLSTAGRMSDLEAEKYDLLPTSGSLSIKDFRYQSDDLPQGFNISQGNLTLTPKEINLASFAATTGRSDFNLTGKVTNFLAYALDDREILKAQLNFTSNLIDLNELMPDEAESITAPSKPKEKKSKSQKKPKTGKEEVASKEQAINESLADTSAMKIPENIDFLLSSKVEQIAYTNLSIKQFNGNIRMKDGAILLEENTFKMLDGTFSLTGSYRTKDLDKPAYDLNFKIKDLSIGSAFSSFETIQKYVPIAKQVSGKFSSNFDVNGLLGSDMMPIMEEIDLSGLVNIAEASLEKGGFIQKLSAVTSLKSGAAGSPEKITVKDVLIKTSIENGRMYVEPFNVKVGGQKATIGGNNGLDGSLDYSMLLKDVPTGAIGSAVNNALSSFTGGKKLVADKVDLNLGIGGTTTDPKVKLLGTGNSSSGSSGGGASAAAKQQVNAQLDEQKAKAKEELDKQKEEQRKKIIAEAESQAASIRKQGEESAAKIRKEGYAAAEKLIDDAGSNPIKKKLAQEAAKKLKKETDKKADAVIAEANKQADRLVAEAKEKADAL